MVCEDTIAARVGVQIMENDKGNAGKDLHRRLLKRKLGEFQMSLPLHTLTNLIKNRPREKWPRQESTCR